MATQPDDDLDQQIDTPENPENPDLNDSAPGDEEADVTLPGEEPSPEGANEGESRVIREFRERERAKDKELRELRQKVEAAAVVPPPGDPGPKPTLEEHGWLDEKYEEALDEWYTRKAAFESAKAQAAEQAQRVEAARLEGYTAAKSATRIAGIDDAEKRVFAQVDDMTRNAILHAKSPAIVAALDRYPDKLAEISNLARTDPAGMLIALGELRAKAQIMPRRKTTEPEEINQGSASISGAGASDKKLERLQKAADKPGADRTELIRYKAQLRAQGK